MTTRLGKFLCCLLASLFFVNGLIIPVQAQRRAIVVNAEQPNVWTLEQAHYLLAQMHRRNLDLRATGLGALDPNEINGLNFEVLRTLVEFGVAFDDAARFNNSLLRPQRQANAERALRLQRRRDELSEDSFNLSRDIARLERERAFATTQEEKDNLAAQIAELTSLRQTNQTTIEQLDKDIAGAGAPSGDVQATAPPEPTGANRLPTSTFDESFQEVTRSLINRFNEAPKLNASLRLDNFLQLQYEIIAKQLTLLRDEVGPDERIIFLEMPQSVNATYNKADKKWAQSWWKVAGYTTPRDKTKVTNDKQRSLKRLEADQTGGENESSTLTGETYSPFFIAQDFSNRRRFASLLKRGRGPLTSYIVDSFSPRTRELLGEYRIDELPSAALMNELVREFNELVLDKGFFESSRFRGVALAAETAELANQSPQGEDLLRLNRKLLEEAYPGEIRTILINRETITTRKITRDAIDAFGVDGQGSSSRVNYIELPDGPRSNPRDKDAESEKEITVEDRSVRTIDLIPRQGSLNVNDIKLRVKSGVLSAVAKFLFGFGASLNVQRQRETFSQFVQQELYSSSFGKGAREFGWTFAPMPGTDRVLSGSKTTYAVMVVPNEAEALIMYANGCSFPRAEYQPIDFEDTLQQRWSDLNNSSRSCGGRKAFAVPIPGGGDETNYDFWVDGLRYVPAAKAERVTLLIYGRNFPSQVGILVDGIPLTQSIGVAQPLIRDDSQAFADARAELRDGKVLGHFERIDANQIVAVFERPGGRDGAQPVLTITAPGKAMILNRLRLRINGVDQVLNDDDTPLLFGSRPAERPFRIDKIDVFKDIDPRFLVAAVSGAGFKDDAGNETLVKILLNGQDISTGYYLVDSSTLLRIRVPIPNDATIKVSLLTSTSTIESSPIANPGKLLINNVAVISYDPETETAPSTIVVKLEGSGFSDDVMAYLNEEAAANALRLAVKSSTEAILKVDNPDAAVVVILRDTRTGQQTRTVITRKRP